jgi:hypothetical protein
MRNYFCKKREKIYYEISNVNLEKSIKFNILEQLIYDMYTQKENFDWACSIFKKINNVLLSYGLELNNLKNFN